MRAVRYEGGRDAIMMTLVLSVLQMSKSLTYISCTLITLKRACCNCRRSCLLAAALGVSERATPSTKFVLCRGPPKNNAGVEKERRRDGAA